MENASKALVIAGAILISIVLITLGVVILGQGQDVVNSSSMDAEALSSWNSKFTQYQGETVNGSSVNALIDAVTSSNVVSNREDEVNKLIILKAGGSTANDIKVDSKTDNKKNVHGGTEYTASVTTKAKAAATYSVKFTTNSAGYVREITIKANTNK